MDYNRRKDANENDIVEYARLLGYSVERLYYVGRGVPDLLVGGLMACPHCGHLFWQEKVVEVKRPGERLRPNQVKWWQEWNNDPRIAYRTEDIDRLTGRIRQAGIRDGEVKPESADQEGREARVPQEGNAHAGGTRRLSKTHRA